MYLWSSMLLLRMLSEQCGMLQILPNFT